VGLSAFDAVVNRVDWTANPLIPTFRTSWAHYALWPLEELREAARIHRISRKRAYGLAARGMRAQNGYTSMLQTRRLFRPRGS
jgi:hypothetical protein